MFRLIKQIISDLGFFRRYGKSRENPFNNPIVNWWRERDFDQKYVSSFFTNPPSLAVPLDDEEVLTALLHIDVISREDAIQGALSEGRIRSRSALINESCSLIVAPVIFIFLLGGLFAVGEGSQMIRALLASLFLVMAIASPAYWYLTVVSKLRFGRYLWTPAITVGLGIVFVVLFQTMRHFTPVPVNSPTLTRLVYILGIIAASVVLAAISYWLALKSLMKAVHEKRLNSC